jgi:uncharacterized protein (TIGR02679 family)
MTMTARPFDGPEYRRLLAAARRSLERTGGSLDGSVSVSAPDDAERKAIIGITGQYREAGVARLTVRLADLDAAACEAGSGGLAALLAELAGGPLRDRPAMRLKVETGVEAAVRSAEESFLAFFDWFAEWLGQLRRDGTLTRLVNAGEQGRVGQAVGVLEAMDGRPAPVLLQSLAAEVTGDSHALDGGTTLSTLVLRALALRLGVPRMLRPAAAEDRRELWDSFDVIVDDLASRVLVLGLPAQGDGLGEWLSGAAARGVPFYATLHQLVTMPVEVWAPVVHVCENPGVLRAACEALGPSSLPLICTEGRPSTAFHRLAAAVVADGGELRYHGDFDWPGIAIAGSVMSRHGAVPWRFSASDYLAGVRADGQHVALSGTPQPTPWDDQLATAMTDRGRVVYEESVTAALLADLGKAPAS